MKKWRHFISAILFVCCVGMGFYLANHSRITPVARTVLSAIFITAGIVFFLSHIIKKDVTFKRLAIWLGCFILLLILLVADWKRLRISQILGDGTAPSIQCVFIKPENSLTTFRWMPDQTAEMVVLDGENLVTIIGGDPRPVEHCLSTATLYNYWFFHFQNTAGKSDISIYFNDGTNIKFYAAKGGWTVKTSEYGWLPGTWLLDAPLADCLDSEVMRSISTRSAKA